MPTIIQDWFTVVITNFWPFILGSKWVISEWTLWCVIATHIRHVTWERRWEIFLLSELCPSVVTFGPRYEPPFNLVRKKRKTFPCCCLWFNSNPQPDRDILCAAMSLPALFDHCYNAPNREHDLKQKLFFLSYTPTPPLTKSRFVEEWCNRGGNSINTDNGATNAWECWDVAPRVTLVHEFFPPAQIS